MAATKMRIDPATQARLGSQVLADLAVNLWPMNCQTCGRPLGRWGRPALEVRAEDGFAAASLHHSRCRPPAWVEGRVQPTGRRHCTWRAGCFLLPPGDLPIFLVNPSYEYAYLREDGGAGWRISNLEAFTLLGFGLEFPSKPLPPLPVLSASIDGERISVDVQNDGEVLHAWHDVPISPDIARKVHDWGDIMIAATTLVDVDRPFTVTQVAGLLESGQVALAQARLASVAYSPAAQELKQGDRTDEQVESFALSGVSMRQALKLEIHDGLVAAAFALSEGKTSLIRRLTGRDRIAVLLMVSAYYALWSRNKAGEPARAGGVHLIARDAASADELMDDFSTVGKRGAIGSVGRLGASPFSGEGAAAYLSDIVIGTVEEFAAAFDAYSGAGPDWDLHASRGYLAIVTGTATSGLVREDFDRHYPKVAAV